MASAKVLLCPAADAKPALASTLFGSADAAITKVDASAPKIAIVVAPRGSSFLHTLRLQAPPIQATVGIIQNKGHEITPGGAYEALAHVNNVRKTEEEGSGKLASPTTAAFQQLLCLTNRQANLKGTLPPIEISQIQDGHDLNPVSIKGKGLTDLGIQGLCIVQTQI